jgi:protein-S-isoprenylcysteine O-methyltransferase Ste14
MFVTMRALAYASLFVGLMLVFVPARLLGWTGIAAPVQGPLRSAGMVVAVMGGVLALWCVMEFARRGRGTPAPFDPPRRLVTTGPYRWVRNPMYVGAGLALAGAALVYGSIALWAYLALFMLTAHLAVVLYEEPTLKRVFGRDYASYRRAVGRWWPRPGRGPTPPIPPE